MRRITMVLIGMFLLIGIVTSATLTVNQFTSISDNQIKDYLLNNLQSEDVEMNKRLGMVYFYHSTVGFTERFDEETNETYFETTTNRYKQALKIDDVQFCLDHYSEETCWDSLVFNLNIVFKENITETYEECHEECHEFDICEEVCETITEVTPVYIKPVWYQLREQLVKEYNYLKELRDSYGSVDIEGFLSQYESNIPGVGIN